MLFFLRRGSECDPDGHCRYAMFDTTKDSVGASPVDVCHSRYQDFRDMGSIEHPNVTRRRTEADPIQCLLRWG